MSTLGLGMNIAGSATSDAVGKGSALLDTQANTVDGAAATGRGMSMDPAGPVKGLFTQNPTALLGGAVNSLGSVFGTGGPGTGLLAGIGSMALLGSLARMVVDASVTRGKIK